VPMVANMHGLQPQRVLPAWPSVNDEGASHRLYPHRANVLPPQGSLESAVTLLVEACTKRRSFQSVEMGPLAGQRKPYVCGTHNLAARSQAHKHQDTRLRRLGAVSRRSRNGAPLQG
jgi:hypothetical protein